MNILVSERGFHLKLEAANVYLRRLGVPEEASFAEAQAFLAELGFEDFSEFQRYVEVQEYLTELRAAHSVNSGTDPIEAPVMASERPWWLLVLLFYVMAAAVVCGAETSQSVPAGGIPGLEDIPVMQTEYTVDRETWDAINQFQQSGLTIVELLQQFKQLRRFAAEAAEETRTYKERAEQLERDSAECDGAKPRCRCPTVWQRMWGTQATEDDQDVLVVMGCETAMCCIELLVQLGSEMAMQGWQLTKLIFIDPLSFGSQESHNLWLSRILGFTLGFVVINILAYIYLELTWLLKKLKTFLSLPLKTPVFRVLRDWFSWI